MVHLELLIQDQNDVKTCYLHNTNCGQQCQNSMFQQNHNDDAIMVIMIAAATSKHSRQKTVRSHLPDTVRQIHFTRHFQINIFHKILSVRYISSDTSKEIQYIPTTKFVLLRLNIKDSLLLEAPQKFVARLFVLDQLQCRLHFARCCFSLKLPYLLKLPKQR